MKKSDRIKFILDTLERLYPKTPIPLTHKDPFTLLIAVLLSGQSTDKSVNKVTPELFEMADTAEKMSKARVKDIQRIIKSVGLSPTKSKNIKALSQILVKKFNGIVPNNYEDLESLPGVGHKTAAVVMSQAFKEAAFPVDTHIHRLAKRWKLSSGKNVVQTENDLKKAFPKDKWNKLHLQMIFFGREYCPARNHNEKECPICSKI